MAMPGSVIKLSIQRMICTGCGAEANASCNCGKAYIPAAQRAKEEAAKDPNASVRTIAERAGVGVRTAHEAKQAVSEETPATDTVVGRDGKSYPARRRSTVEDEIEAPNYRGAFLIRADQAREFAVYSGPITNEIIAMARQVAISWSKLADDLERKL